MRPLCGRVTLNILFEMSTSVCYKSEEPTINAYWVHFCRSDLLFFYSSVQTKLHSRNEGMLEQIVKGALCRPLLIHLFMPKHTK